MKLGATFVAITFVLVGFAESAENCDQKQQRLQSLNKHQSLLKGNLARLEAEFLTQTEKDFDDTSNRIIATLSRNRAKKAFFAKRRVEERIEENQKELEYICEKYCGRCEKHRNSAELCSK